MRAMTFVPCEVIQSHGFDGHPVEYSGEWVSLGGASWHALGGCTGLDGASSSPSVGGRCLFTAGCVVELRLGWQWYKLSVGECVSGLPCAGVIWCLR